MANLSNINNVLRVSSNLRVGINTDAASYALEIGGTNSGIKLKNSGASGKVYSLLSDTSGNFQIYDDAAASGRLVINSAGNATFAGNITFGDSHFIGDDASDNLLIQSSANENIIIDSLDETLFRINGSTKMQIKSSGNVGIGTTSPTEGKLVVVGRTALKASNTGEVALRIQRATSVGRSQYTLETETGSQIWRCGMTGPGSTDYGFFDGVQNAITIKYRGDIILTPAGNVGIGTTSPEQKLHVEGTIQLGNTEHLSWAYDNGSYYNYITNGYNSTDGVTYRSGSWTSTQTIICHSFETYTGGWQKRLVIRQDGNVGIGTNSPTYKLHLNNSATLTATYQKFTNGTATTGTTLGIDADGDFLINNGENKEIKLYTSDSQRLTIQSGGNVGIGITNPQDKLHVNGDAIISTTRYGDFAVASINTTGYAIANVAASTNGQSSIVEFVASGGAGAYYNVVYSIYNGGGLWYYTKNVVGSGGNIEVAETNGSGSSTLIFYFRATSGTQAYTPRVMMKASPYNYVTF